jgi:hypothetical protein
MGPLSGDGSRAAAAAAAAAAAEGNWVPGIGSDTCIADIIEARLSLSAATAASTLCPRSVPDISGEAQKGSRPAFSSAEVALIREGDGAGCR